PLLFHAHPRMKRFTAHAWVAHRKNLVASVLYGKASLPASAAAVEFASGVRCVIGVVLAALLVWLIV
ncbi:MAG: hypothetical protein ABW034_06625, partial [Steroidobacteraceae bacterium]